MTVVTFLATKATALLVAVSASTALADTGPFGFDLDKPFDASAHECDPPEIPNVYVCMSPPQPSQYIEAIAIIHSDEAGFCEITGATKDLDAVPKIFEILTAKYGQPRSAGLGFGWQWRIIIANTPVHLYSGWMINLGGHGVTYTFDTPKCAQLMQEVGASLVDEDEGSAF